MTTRSGPRPHLRLPAATAALALVLSVLALAMGASPAQALPPIGAITSGNADSNTVDISADGRFVLFSSLSSNLVLPSTGHVNAFLRDRTTGNTAVLTQANADVTPVAISNDGRYATFLTTATNLVPGSSNKQNLYQLDRQTGTFRLLVNGTGDSATASASADGRFVAFRYASSPGGTPNIRVWDRATNSSVGITAGNGTSTAPRVSDDGRYVTFSSIATNLVNPASTAHFNVFQWDRSSGTTTLVTNGNGDSFVGAATPDGRYVVVDSQATNLVAGSTATHNLYAWDRSGPTLTRLTNGDDASHDPSISTNGRYVTFESSATNLGPATSNHNPKIFVRDRTAATTTLLSANADTARIGDASPDGRYVAYKTLGTHGGEWLRDRTAGASTRLTDSAAESYLGPQPKVNSTGTVVVFDSTDSALVSPPVSAHQNVFAADLAGVPLQKFVKAAYTDFLHRAPTANELSTQTTALQGGKTRTALLKELAGSPEWVSGIINQLYLNTLGRNGDTGGVTYWANEIRSGRRTVANVAANFYASDEYFAHIGGGTNDTWVSDLYTKLLHRPADAAGRTYWSNQATFNGRFSVAIRFYQSDESARTRVNDLYIALLGRNGDPGGVTFWAGKVVTEGDIALAVNLASSDEYLGRAQSRFA